MFQWEFYVSLGVLIIVIIVPRSVFTKCSSIKLYKEDKRLLFNSAIALGCYMYWLRKTYSTVTGNMKRVTEKPLSSCRLLFSRAFRCTPLVTSPPSTPSQRTIENLPETRAAEIHPVQMTKILRDVFHDPQTAHKYAKHLDKKIQTGASVSLDSEIVPDLESTEDTPC